MIWLNLIARIVPLRRVQLRVTGIEACTALVQFGVRAMENETLLSLCWCSRSQCSPKAGIEGGEYPEPSLHTSALYGRRTLENRESMKDVDGVGFECSDGFG